MVSKPVVHNRKVLERLRDNLKKIVASFESVEAFDHGLQNLECVFVFPLVHSPWNNLSIKLFQLSKVELEDLCRLALISSY